MVVRSVSVGELEEMMRAGVVRDGCTLSAWGLYLLWKARREREWLGSAGLRDAGGSSGR